MLDTIEAEHIDAPHAELTLVLVQDEADAQALKAAGYKSVRVAKAEESVCSIVGGKAVVDPVIDFFATVAIAVHDPDLRDGLAVRVGDTKCRWVDWSSLGGSAAAAYAQGSAKAIQQAMDAARPMWSDEVCLMSDIPEPGPQQSYASGFKMLDEHGFRLIRPAFMPIIGPYGSGKSVLVRQLACNLYRLHGWRCLITAFEEKIRPRYQRDLRQHLIGKEQMDQHGELYWSPKHQSQWTAGDVAKADEQIEHGFRFLRRKRNDVLDADRLIDRIEYAVRVYGVEVVIIDPVNEIDHQVPRGMSKTDYMGAFMMKLKQLADDYQLLMIVLAHPPKDGVSKRSEKGKILTLNDGADTAHYGNKADIGWCVWRSGIDDFGPTYLNIDKLKDHDVMGRPTLAKLMLDKGLGRFSVTKVGYADVLGEIAGGVGD